MSLLKKVAIIFSVPIFCVILYFVTAKLLMFFPSKPLTEDEKNQKIYLLYGDIHTDIVLNLKDLNPLWFQNIEPIKDKKEGYLSIGWGDKESYLHPGTYDTIPMNIILKAFFLNTASLLQVRYHQKIEHYLSVKTIKLSKKQLDHLTRSLFRDFDFEAKAYKGYSKNAHFYSSPHAYNLINTCNTYTGDKLREANISMSYWTPLKDNVIDALP